MHNNLHYHTIMLTHNFKKKSDLKLKASTSLRKSVFLDPKLFESVELPQKVTMEFLFLFYFIFCRPLWRSLIVI